MPDDTNIPDDRESTDGAQLELPFPDDDSTDATRAERASTPGEPMTFTQEDAGGAPTCGTCGEPIRGEVYVNRFGPAHYRCWLRETL